VLFEGRTDAGLAARATQTLDAAFPRIAQALRASPSDPIAVILYTDKQFRDVTRAPAWSGGLYDGRIRIPVAGAVRTPALFNEVLVHELTHAMIASLASRGVPTWLHEGLAQYFSGVDATAARRRIAKGQSVIRLEDLEGSFEDFSDADATLAYDESLVAIDALARRGNLNWAQLLYALDESETPAAALGRFGISYAELNAMTSR
jgi:hypothetical protein